MTGGMPNSIAMVAAYEDSSVPTREASVFVVAGIHIGLLLCGTIDWAIGLVCGTIIRTCRRRRHHHRRNDRSVMPFFVMSFNAITRLRTLHLIPRGLM